MWDDELHDGDETNPEKDASPSNDDLGDELVIDDADDDMDVESNHDDLL